MSYRSSQMQPFGQRGNAPPADRDDRRDPSYEGTPAPSERRLFLLSVVGLALIAVVATAVSLWR
jgi:hypothetical protein